MTEAEIRAAETILMAGTWAITAGALLFSVLTVTPLVRSVSPAGWEWTAPILPLVVDAAVVIVVRLDSVISRLGGSGGAWPTILRWMTGIMTLALNVGSSALHRDWVGMAVHSVAPLLLIVTAEAGLAYRRAITAALARIAGEQAAAQERDRLEREAQAKEQREERERAQAARQQAEREAREREDALAQEQADREAARLLADREHELALERERAKREEQQERLRLEEQQAARDHALLVERDRAEREAAERRRREDREERERREALARAAKAQERAVPRLAGVSPAKTSRTTGVRADVPETGSRRVEVVVMDDAFAKMTQAEAEAALFEQYKAARDANTFDDWKTDNPLFRPGGLLCGSSLGRRLGRTAAAGRINVMPKFEQQYDAYLAGQNEPAQELLGVG
ncbi:DUF2637 domain-containing protein [Streptomyces virginiae]|uniref:DUF2637 domain-containing protein n=1 Tax=Streptomyces virginiae TaxID=1961 RepID=UPI0036659B13